MASTWHTVATRDVCLLRRQLDIVASLPREYTFQNYLRCHDDIGWGLDYDYLKNFAIEEVPHKKYLNDFLTGKYPNSFARGELYNDDPVWETQDSAEQLLPSAESSEPDLKEMKKVPSVQSATISHSMLLCFHSPVFLSFTAATRLAS